MCIWFFAYWTHFICHSTYVTEEFLVYTNKHSVFTDTTLSLHTLFVPHLPHHRRYNSEAIWVIICGVYWWKLHQAMSSQLNDWMTLLHHARSAVTNGKRKKLEVVADNVYGVQQLLLPWERCQILIGFNIHFYLYNIWPVPDYVRRLLTEKYVL